MIIVYTDGGLGSRLSCLANGLFIVNSFSSRSRIFWPVNDSCAINFDEIFNCNLVVEDLNKTDIRLLKNCSILSSDNFLNLPVEYFLDPWGVRSGTEVFDWCLRQLQSERVLVVFGHRIFPQFYSDVAKILVTKIPFQRYVVERAVSVESRLVGRQAYFGFHLRGTDGGRDGHYLSITFCFLKILSEKFRARVFLATDDMLFVRYTRNFIPRVIVPRRNLPQKKYKNLGWTSLIIDSNFERQPYNIIRDKHAVIDAAIDVILLSRSKFLVINSTSTFLEISGLLSGVWLRRIIFLSIARMRHFRILYKKRQLAGLVTSSTR